MTADQAIHEALSSYFVDYPVTFKVRHSPHYAAYQVLVYHKEGGELLDDTLVSYVVATFDLPKVISVMKENIEKYKHSKEFDDKMDKLLND